MPVNVDGQQWNSETVRTAMYGLGGSVAFLLVYVGIWWLADPGAYLVLILSTYCLLAVVALVQLLRASYSREWLQLFAIVPVVLGLLVTVFAGLRPKTPCIDFGPCASGLTPQPEWLVVGVLLTAFGITLDLRTST